MRLTCLSVLLECPRRVHGTSVRILYHRAVGAEPQSVVNQSRRHRRILPHHFARTPPRFICGHQTTPHHRFGGGAVEANPPARNDILYLYGFIGRIDFVVWGRTLIFFSFVSFFAFDGVQRGVMVVDGREVLDYRVVVVVCLLVKVAICLFL